MADLKAFAEQLVNLTVKEVNELATILKEEYGIEPAAAAVAVAAGPAAGGAAAADASVAAAHQPVQSGAGGPALRDAVHPVHFSVLSGHLHQPDHLRLAARRG